MMPGDTQNRLEFIDVCGNSFEADCYFSFCLLKDIHCCVMVITSRSCESKVNMESWTVLGVIVSKFWDVHMHIYSRIWTLPIGEVATSYVS
ncbi:hypothetical protein SK128_007464 [Halocaridina rubra]|uniref:Uncharacterized protein n=1 Tax=Halocaridina rubra TaxID=373956 RepID=A0AAN8XIV2_HALRR